MTAQSDREAVLNPNEIGAEPAELVRATERMAHAEPPIRYCPAMRGELAEEFIVFAGDQVLAEPLRFS